MAKFSENILYMKAITKQVIKMQLNLIFRKIKIKIEAHLPSPSPEELGRISTVE